MAFLQNTAIIIPLVAASLYGSVKVSKIDMYPRVDDILNQNTMFGIIMLMHAMFGITPIGEPPKITKPITSSVWFKLISLFIISFSATRDFEDAVLVVITFLGLIQLLRTQEERKKYPYIIA